MTAVIYPVEVKDAVEFLANWVKLFKYIYIYKLYIYIYLTHNFSQYCPRYIYIYFTIYIN